MHKSEGIRLDGLLLKLRQDDTGEPGFWRLFTPIRQDLDRLFWCFTNQPWGAAPEGFEEDESATASFPEVYAADANARMAAFGTAGLSEVWAALTGKLSP